MGVVVSVFFVIISIIVLYVGYIMYLRFKWKHSTCEDFLNFLVKSPEKSSAVMMSNDATIIGYQANQVKPLASTCKIITAIEYAKQVAERKIDPDDRVSLLELERFYLANTDGNAHPQWLQYVRNKGSVHQEKVSLKEVAKGMIALSSNANTEYLLAKLGVDRINETLSLLNVKSHTNIYPMTSATLIPTYVKHLENITDDKQWKQRIIHMPQEEFEKYALEIHQQLRHDTDHSFRDRFFQKECMDESFQYHRSRRLPAASASDYARLMHGLNKRTLFSAEIHDILQDLLETKGDDRLQHMGFKGGSTLFNLTFALYATTKTGEQIELVVLIDDEFKNPSLWMENIYSDFIKKMLFDLDFRKKAALRLMGSNDE